MSTSQEKTEAPSAKKRKDTRDKGEVPRSQELTTAFLLLAAAVAVNVGGGIAARDLSQLFRFTNRSIATLPEDAEGMAGFLGEAGWIALGAIFPFVAILAGTALVVSAIQARGILSTKPLAPNWGKLNPLSTAKRIWGVQAVAQLAKSIAKLLLISGVIYVALTQIQEELPALAQQGPMALLFLFQKYAVKVLAMAGGAYLFLAAADYAFQIWQHEKKLKMSKEELRKEHKESEGDQVMKVRRRTMGRQLARRRMLLSVSDADVVVTNPTRIAVALKYDPERGPAPIVLAMGVRKTAAKIREIARESGVPLIENKPLAGALWATARIGFPIPIDLYIAVAEVLAFVIKNRRRGSWSGSEVI